ncbi:MFS transporter [Streptomyces sp. MA5143a]|uniref:MFS transporter n=1 Tax=Streptomyces sp. MA5143a TaxID=2083010 RepID=UPI000D1B7767|nr:MFS transporter [Streptomyces sp. MA5143a]SPF07298.1 putative multidrug-efflux transporterc/MT1297 [Streptomyces sp. MA5143a]
MKSLTKPLVPLRHRDYRLLFVSYLISMVGDGVWLVALPWVAIELGADNSGLALVVGAESVGLISCVLIGGALADRYPRKQVIGWSYTAGCTVLAALAVIHLSGYLEVWHLVGGAFVLGAAAAVSGPAADAFTPDLVPEDDLHAANALESIVRSLAVRMIGPGVGGLLIALVGSLAVITLNALSFAVAALCVAAISFRPAGRADGNGQSTENSEQDNTGQPVRYREALRYLFGERWLWVLIVWSGVVLLLQSGPRQVLLPFLIHNDLGGDARDYGLLVAVTGVAAVVSSFVLAARKPPADYARRMLLAWTIGAAPLALMVFSPSLWLLLPLGAVYGFFSTAGNVYWSTLVQTSVPNAVRGRVISIDWLGSLALVPLSAALAGIGSSQQYTLWVFVLGGTLPVLLTLITLRWVDLRGLGTKHTPHTTPHTPAEHTQPATPDTPQQAHAALSTDPAPAHTTG